MYDVPGTPDVKFAIVASVLWLVSFLAVSAHNSLLSIVLIPLGLLLIIAIVMACVSFFVKWRTRTWRAALPLAVCIMSIFLSLKLAQPFRYLVFAHYLLPSYEVVVHEVESGAIPLSLGSQELPQGKSEARLVFEVSAEKCDNGVVMIEFLTEDCGYAYYGAYIFSSSGKIEPGSRMDSRWPNKEEVSKGWFYVSF